MELTPVLAHGGDLLVFPMLIAGVLTIMIAMRGEKRQRPPTPSLPNTSLGRQVRAAMRPPRPRPEPPPPSPRPARQDRRALRVLRDREAVETVPRRWNG